LTILEVEKLLLLTASAERHPTFRGVVPPLLGSVSSVDGERPDFAAISATIRGVGALPCLSGCIPGHLIKA
jgi:hypothetical protein